MLTDKLDSRVKFPKGEQRKFLEQTLSVLDVKPSELAAISGVCDRTLRDWRREKFTMSLSSLKTIYNRIDITVPSDVKILPKYWSVKKAGKLGGRRYAELYGSPGTPESRRKGGIQSQRKFRSNPAYAKRIGFMLRKKIKYPNKSKLLAEFIGIMFGDGGVSGDHQITISFNGEKDQNYALYIQHITENLFGISSTQRIRKKEGRADIVISGKNLVEFLEKIGIKKGNKVINQIDIPNWIFEHKKYRIGCLRGLFDTDGCIYRHNYKVSGKSYSYTKMSFRNYSIPLLKSIKKMLESLDFHPVIDVKHQTVYINRSVEVKKYFSEINSDNPRYQKNLLNF